MFAIAIFSAPPVDLDGIREPVFGSILTGNNPITAAVCAHFRRNRGFTSIPCGRRVLSLKWLYNGGPYQLIIFHFLIGIWAYLGRQWELSYRLGMRPLDCGCFFVHQ